MGANVEGQVARLDVVAIQGIHPPVPRPVAVIDQNRTGQSRARAQSSDHAASVSSAGARPAFAAGTRKAAISHATSRSSGIAQIPVSTRNSPTAGFDVRTANGMATR